MGNTINFYIRVLKTLNDVRTPRSIADEIVKKCPKFNVFDTIREDLINCKTLQRKIDNKNRKIIKDFRIGCMKKILTNIRNKCPIFKKSRADKVYSAGLKVLSNLTKPQQRRLRYMGNRFIKIFSLKLRVYKKLVDKRLEILRKIELKRKMAAAKKAKKKGKGKKKKFFLELSAKVKNENTNSNINASEKKKVKKGKKKGPKNAMKLKIPANNAYDEKFNRETFLDPAKSTFLAKFVVKSLMKINRV